MKKIFGWILLILGVLIILWGVWSSYQIFNAEKPIPEIFRIEKGEDLVTEETPEGDSQMKVSQEIQQAIKEQFSQMFPPEFTSKIFNLISWSIFMFILIAAGGKIAFIGIKLLK